jgi:hypothetical protein
VPVSVWKHCRRKRDVSRTSMPEGGSGRSSAEGGGAGIGERRVEMAWTLGRG